MAIIKDGEKAREILETVSSNNQSLPCFCTESVYTTEAIFMGAKQYMDQENITGPFPLIIAFTASYNDRQQLKNYTGLGDFKEGMLAVKADIERLARNDGPYHNLEVIVHLDHAQPGQDDWIVEDYGDFISSVMWDCSHFSMSDNISMMKKFTRKNRSRFIIEGAVDEIYNYNAKKVRSGVIDQITNPELAAKYHKETACDLIVANLGTEHRRTEGTVEYHRDVAREITNLVGRKLVLHGSSSLKKEDLDGLQEDGIVKVNLWGKLESDPGKKLAEVLIRNLENLLSKDQVDMLIQEGYLKPEMSSRTYRPSIQFLTEKYRRDEVYLPEAANIVRETYKALY
jgi:fructose/tagatose bisphosphate aldolase